MKIDHKYEKELINKALDGDFVDILEYVKPQVESMVDAFLSTPKGIELEIPKQSLIKASEKYLISAVNKFNEIMPGAEVDDEISFIKYYIWFADKGINEYAAQWELMLGGHMSSCNCSGH